VKCGLGGRRPPGKLPTMARKLRWECEGGLYHVFNRGNYRRDVFGTAGATHSFEEALIEIVGRQRWKLHGYVIMRNHFHLALETPEPNLGQGLHWLLSSVATRFNRFRSEQGHLFQGRYSALPVEDLQTLSRVVDYIHLNPVRARLIAMEQIADYRPSSLHRFIRSRTFPGLDPTRLAVGRSALTPLEGWDDYLEYLTELAANLEEQRAMGFEGFSTGWAIGSTDWRRSLAKELAQSALVSGLRFEEARAIREARWQTSLDSHLSRLGRNLADARAARKGADWKLQLAQRTRQDCGASIAWLARTLSLGAIAAARARLSELRHIKM